MELTFTEMKRKEKEVLRWNEEQSGIRFWYAKFEIPMKHQNGVNEK